MTSDQPPDRVKVIIAVGVVLIAVLLAVAVVIRSIFREEIDPQAMLAVWNPVVALLGGLVGYVAGRSHDSGE